MSGLLAICTNYDGARMGGVAITADETAVKSEFATYVPQLLALVAPDFVNWVPGRTGVSASGS